MSKKTVGPEAEPEILQEEPKKGTQKAAGAESGDKEAKEKKPKASGSKSKPKEKETKKGAEAPKAETSEAEEDANTRYLRLMADFQNYKKRVEKEKNDIYAFANEKLVLEVLNVIDNFDRALGGEIDKSASEGFVSGMNMIFKQLKEVLEKAGVVEIEALGADFDPNFHNAVMMEDSSEYESGKITAVLQKGYLLNNKVIRPAMVKVAN